MKRKILVFISLILFVSAMLDGCSKKYLDEPALGSFSESSLANEPGVEGLLIGAYSMLDGISDPNTSSTNFTATSSNWIFGDLPSDDAYTGSQPASEPWDDQIEDHLTNATNFAVGNRWNALFDGLQRANSVLRVMENAKNITDAQKVLITAQARFLRGWYNFEAKKIWNMIPYIDETISYEDNNIDVPNNVDIWPKIEDDFNYAIANLPNDWMSTGEIGRANKWVAECMLAKSYLYEHKYADAIPIWNEIITKGVTSAGVKYALVANYHDNFSASTKNNSEAIFSVQQSINDGSGGLNAGWGDIQQQPNSPAPVGGCCNFKQPTQNFVNAFKTDPVTGLPLLDDFNNADVNNDMGVESTSSFTPYTGTLDPRLDWTVSRRGIPFLDWGINPGKVWIRDQSNGGPYFGIKRIYMQSEKSTYEDKTFWTDGVSANNYVFIRFSDVLLMAAECEVEAGSLEKARDYVNQIRTRVTNPAGWLHTYIDDSNPLKGFTNIPAANYKIGLYTAAWADQNYARKAVQFERRLELGQEGHRFFDLVRYGTVASVLATYLSKEKTFITHLNGVTFTANKNEYFPIPQTEIDKSHGALKQNPNY